jgi:UDP:flavonoid glycosyltransferase YjiC (YdhE family)
MRHVDRQRRLAGAAESREAGHGTWPGVGQEPGQDIAAVPPGPAQLDLQLRQALIDPVPAQHESLRELLADAGPEPVLLIQEATFAGGWAAQLGAPGPRPAATLGLGVTPLYISSVDHAPFALGLAPDSSPEGRLRNQETNAVFQQQILGGAQAHFAGILERLGVTGAVQVILDGSVSVPDLFLQLTVPGAEYPRSDAPDSLRYIGYLSPGVGERPLPDWWQDVVDADRGVVISQGTLANQDFSELIEPALRALADLDLLAVAVLGRPAELAAVPANARVAEFIPFAALLPQADVLVTDGGYGTVQQGLAAGVPMVLAGDTEDKIEVTARAAWTGAAVNLATGHPTAAALRAAVQHVLSDPGYRARAEDLRGEHAKYSPLNEISDAVDELAARFA